MATRDAGYRLQDAEAAFYRDTYRKRSLGRGLALKEIHEAAGHACLHMGLPGLIPLTTLRLIVRSITTCPKTVKRRLDDLLGSPLFAVEGDSARLTYFHLTYGGAAEATARLQALRLGEAVRARRSRARRGQNRVTYPVGCQKSPAKTVTYKPVTLNIRDATRAVPPDKPSSPSKIFEKNKQSHPCSAQAPKSEEADKGTVTLTGAAASFLAMAAPAMALSAVRVAQVEAQDAARAAQTKSRPPVAIRSPKLSERPQRALTVVQAPDPYVGKVVTQEYVYKEIRGRKGFESVNAAPFIAMGATVQVMLDACHLVDTATTKIRNPAGALNRAARRLILRQWRMA